MSDTNLARGSNIVFPKDKQGKSNFINAINKHYADGNYEKLFKSLQGVTKTWTQQFVNKWDKKYRIEIDDVIAQCNLRLWQLMYREQTEDGIRSYYKVNKNYLFYLIYRYHIFNGVFKDILKNCQRPSKTLCYDNWLLQSWDKMTAENDDVIDDKAGVEIANVFHKMQVDIIYSYIGKGVFEPQEEALLLALRDNPEASLRDLGTFLNTHHPEIVKRKFKKLRNKLKTLGLDWEEWLY